MPEQFPIISQRRLSRIIHRINKLDLVEGVSVGAELHRYENKTGIALHAGLTFNPALEDSTIVSGAVDDALSDIAGIHFTPSDHFDNKYGSHQKYYFIQTSKGLWVGLGDNCYGETEGRLLIYWHEPVAREEFESAKKAIKGLEGRSETIFSGED